MSAEKSWIILALRGLLALLFGLAALVWPELSLRLLVYLFGIFALADGFMSVVQAITGQPPGPDWWLSLLRGLASIAVGIAVFVWPLLTAILLLVFIAIRAIILGTLDIISAIKWREEAAGLGLLILGGILSVAFGLFVLLRPGEGAMALLWLVAVYAIVVGAVQIVLAFVMRGRARAVGLPGIASPPGEGQ
jgi:uncharacterized membrane protein HdeD (DUF308 family)